jgi:CspA family cold shock protein
VRFQPSIFDSPEENSVVAFLAECHRQAGILSFIPTRGIQGTMASGVVKWFNATKGYGFIAPADGGKDVFVHISAVERAGQKSLQEGQQIQYELVEGRNGRFSAEELVLG